MSKAFTRESDTDADDEEIGLPALPTGGKNYITPVGYARLRAELFDLMDNERMRLAMVFGPCGIGKSSLLRAGLVATLDPVRFEAKVIISGADPLVSVVNAIQAGEHAASSLVSAGITVF